MFRGVERLPEVQSVGLDGSKWMMMMMMMVPPPLLSLVNFEVDSYFYLHFFDDQQSIFLLLLKLKLKLKLVIMNLLLLELLAIEA